MPAGEPDPAAEWRRVCGTDESWYDESSLSPGGGLGLSGARILKLADGGGGKGGGAGGAID